MFPVVRTVARHTESGSGGARLHSGAAMVAAEAGCCQLPALSIPEGMSKEQRESRLFSPMLASASRPSIAGRTELKQTCSATPTDQPLAPSMPLVKRPPSIRWAA